jgi:hypothetical protein
MYHNETLCVHCCGLSFATFSRVPFVHFRATAPVLIVAMLPFDAREFGQGSGKSSLMDGKFPDYMRRLCDIRQMDFEAAFDQLLTLVSLEPQQM